MFKKFTETFVRIDHTEYLVQCDVINTEFKKFLNVEVKTMQRESVTFSQKDGRLDDFYFKLASISKYKDFIVCR